VNTALAARLTTAHFRCRFYVLKIEEDLKENDNKFMHLPANIDRLFILSLL